MSPGSSLQPLYSGQPWADAHFADMNSQCVNVLEILEVLKQLPVKMDFLSELCSRSRL